MKWMNEKWAKTLDRKDNLSEELKTLANDYQKLKSVKELPEFMKKVINVYDKLDNYEKCIVGLLEPTLASMNDKDNFIKNYKEKVDEFINDKKDENNNILNFKFIYKSIENFDNEDTFVPDEEIESEINEENENDDIDKNNTTTTLDNSDTIEKTNDSEFE